MLRTVLLEEQQKLWDITFYLVTNPKTTTVYQEITRVSVLQFASLLSFFVKLNISMLPPMLDTDRGMYDEIKIIQLYLTRYIERQC